MVKTHRPKFIPATTVGGELIFAGSLAAHLQVQKPNMTIIVYLVYDHRFYQIGYKSSENLICIRVQKNRYSLDLLEGVNFKPVPYIQFNS